MQPGFLMRLLFKYSAVHQVCVPFAMRIFIRFTSLEFRLQYNKHVLCKNLPFPRECATLFIQINYCILMTIYNSASTFWNLEVFNFNLIRSMLNANLQWLDTPMAQCKLREMSFWLHRLLCEKYLLIKLLKVGIYPANMNWSFTIV